MAFIPDRYEACSLMCITVCLVAVKIYWYQHTKIPKESWSIFGVFSPFFSKLLNSLLHLLHRFSPGIGNDSVPSSGPMKRRTQSLSALPKDGDRKVNSPLQSVFEGQLVAVPSTAHLLSSSVCHPRGRKTTSAVQWTRSWSSANATVAWFISGIRTRTTGQSARFWGSGGTLWGPMTNSSTTIWPSRWGLLS